MSRPEWVPATEDGISWARTRPIPRGLGEGPYGAGLSQLCRWLNAHSVAPWTDYPDPVNIAFPPDAPIQAAYLQYLRDKTDDVRELCLLDEWTWVHAIEGAPISRDFLTEYRRAIPVADRERMSAILGASYFFSAGTYFIQQPGTLQVYKDSVSANRQMILCDLAAGERETDSSVSIACRMQFARARDNTDVAWSDWPEPVSLRYIPASAIPDQSWDDSHASTLYAYIGAADVQATVSRSDLVDSSTTGSTTTREIVEGWVRVKLPDVPGSGKFWLGATLPNDSAPLASGQGWSIMIRAAWSPHPFLYGPWIYWSEPPA